MRRATMAVTCPSTRVTISVGRRITAETQLAAQCFGLNIDATLLDFQSPDVARVQQGPQTLRIVRHDFLHLEAG